jgi:hypothetical protein
VGPAIDAELEAIVYVLKVLGSRSPLVYRQAVLVDAARNVAVRQHQQQEQGGPQAATAGPAYCASPRGIHFAASATVAAADGRYGCWPTPNDKLYRRLGLNDDAAMSDVDGRLGFIGASNLHPGCGLSSARCTEVFRVWFSRHIERVLYASYAES